MKIGIHAYAWCSEWSNDTLHLIDKTKQLGLDFIELPLMRLDLFDSIKVKKKLNDIGLDAITSTVLQEGYDITSFDATERDKGVEYLKRCVDMTFEIGAKSLSGVVYSQHVKNVNNQPTQQEWEWSAQCLKKVAKYAQQYDINIGIEPVNRYESNLINTCEQARKLISIIDEPNVKIHLDSYHMNIEEKDFYNATKLAGDDLIHYHFCENDRGIPGTGLIDWDNIFRALSEINYQGNIALESFVDLTDNMNTWVWRQLAPSGDELIKEGLKHIRKLQEKYQLD